MSPWPIEDVDGLEEQQARIREQAARQCERPPRDHEARQDEIREWARRAGWL